LAGLPRSVLPICSVNIAMIAVFNPEMEDAMKTHPKLTWSAIFNCVIGGVLLIFLPQLLQMMRRSRMWPNRTSTRCSLKMIRCE
jgi:hypothetical protein